MTLIEAIEQQEANLKSQIDVELIAPPVTLAKDVLRKSAGQQGVHELKQNYHINADTRVLGAGAFGKVFLAKNKHDASFEVAIKVLDKVKLRDSIN